MVECQDGGVRFGGHTSTVLGEAEEVGASALGAAAALLSIQLSKISSKIPKFHLQIVENYNFGQKSYLNGFVTL